MSAIPKPKIKVCPRPDVWNKIYERLMAFWERKKPPGPPPPIPLILSGWFYSNDLEKHVRWTKTIIWADEHHCQHLIGHLLDSDYHQVIEMSSYEVGPGGGPLYLDWNFEPRKRPDDQSLSRALEELRERWTNVAGAELAKLTYPLSFTGEKSRRLLVFADPSNRPPWGEWDKLDRNENRRAFTRFRASVNEAIHPHEVDHIDFIHKKD